MNESNGSIMDVLKASISDVIAGLVLIGVSVIIYYDMHDILRNPLFNAALGLMFLFLAYYRIFKSKNLDRKEKILNYDFNGIIAGLSLLVVSMLGFTGNFDIVRHFIFPLIPGVLLMLIAISKTVYKAKNPGINISIDPCGIVGSEALLLYSLLLYLNYKSLAWSAVFPLFVSMALFVALLIDVLPLLISSKIGIHNATIWLRDVESEISNLRHEFESVKLNYDDPHVKKSLERLNSIYNTLVQIKEINDYIRQSAVTPDYFDQEKLVESITDEIDLTNKLPTEMEPNELEALIVGKSSDQILYENLEKEFDREGLGSIIKEAREMRKAILSQRKFTLDD